MVEHLGASREMDAGEVGGIGDQVSHLGSRAGDKVDDTSGQSCFHQYLHDEVAAVNRGSGRFPDHRVAHQRRGCGKVAGDGGEIEGRDGEDKAFQSAVFREVPFSLGGDEGLLFVNLLRVIGVETPEVNQFAGGVDFGLEGVFALPQHGGGVQQIAVFGGKQFGGSQEDGRAMVERHLLPILACLHGRLDGEVDLLFAAFVVFADGVLVVVGFDAVGGVAAEHFLAVDNRGNFDELAAEFIQLRFQGVSFFGSGCVRFDRFIFRCSNSEKHLQLLYLFLVFSAWKGRHTAPVAGKMKVCLRVTFSHWKAYLFPDIP